MCAASRLTTRPFHVLLSTLPKTALSPRYCLLISGGVDSAVACHLLCCHGIRPDLYYIEIGPQGEGLTCTAEEDIKLSRLTSYPHLFALSWAHGQDLSSGFDEGRAVALFTNTRAVMFRGCSRGAHAVASPVGLRSDNLKDYGHVSPCRLAVSARRFAVPGSLRESDIRADVTLLSGGSKVASGPMQPDIGSDFTRAKASANGFKACRHGLAGAW